VRAREGRGEMWAHVDIDLVLLVGIHGGVVETEVPQSGRWNRSQKEGLSIVERRWMLEDEMMVKSEEWSKLRRCKSWKWMKLSCSCGNPTESGDYR
jgi:hypothetical protein